MSSHYDYPDDGQYDTIYCQNDSEAAMSFSVDVLAKIAIELQTGIGHQDRFQRLISTLRHVLACDASALLRYEGRQFIPLAIDGLAKDVLGRRFTLEGHPRLETI
ncbi:nitric oxide reductase transcription regulator, partial [Enterobacter kobei]